LKIIGGGLALAKRAGQYKSKKRKKELLRQKKQDEKRQRRFKRNANREHDTELTGLEKSEEEKT